MSKYIGQQCTSCRVAFNENDDIVVCPQCGSPYHRDCYKNEGKCVNTLLHERGEDWKPVEILKPKVTPKEEVCPNCGNKNPAGAANCSLCGVSLNRSNDSAADGDPKVWQNPNYRSDTGNGQFNGQDNMWLPPIVNIRTISPDTEVDANTAGEYTSYVGRKFYYYLPKFLRFAKSNSKISFNFAALFFPHIWFFFRKMPIHGIVASSAVLITSLPTIIEYASMLQTGYSSLSENSTFMLISSVCAILNWILSLVCGLFGDYMYYRKAKGDIASVKAAMPDPSARIAEIQKRGGTSVRLVAGAMGVFVVIVWIITAAFML